MQDRNASQKHVWRANIVLLSADSGNERDHAPDRHVEDLRLALAPPQPGSWKKASTACCETRRAPRGFTSGQAEVAERVVALTLADPPTETTHWTADPDARRAELSVCPVPRVWRMGFNRTGGASSSSRTIL